MSNSASPCSASEKDEAAEQASGVEQIEYGEKKGWNGRDDKQILDNDYLRPLSQTRSRSSARSHTDGYSHLRHNDDEEKQQSPRERIPVGVGAEEGKEFEVQFDGDSDPWNPKTKYSTLRKWTIVLIGSGCSLCVTCASALYTSTYLQLEKDFHVSREVATLGLTTYVCGLGLGPMFLSPLSEFFGRRAIYLSAFGMFFIW